MKLKKQYVAGFLENLGGFYIVYRKNRNDLVPRFRINISKENVNKIGITEKCLNYLNSKYNIIYVTTTTKTDYCFIIHQLDSLLNLIFFFEKNCKIKKEHQDEVKESVILKKRIMKKRVEIQKEYKSELKRIIPNEKLKLDDEEEEVQIEEENTN